MNWKRTRLFIQRWLWYTFHNAFAQTFEWLSLIGASFGGFIVAKFRIRAAGDPFKSNLIGVGSGFVSTFEFTRTAWAARTFTVGCGSRQPLVS